MNLILPLLFILLQFANPNSCYADLNPSEVLIVANANNKDSTELASFYANSRKIPEDNIILLKTSDDFAISRDDFEKDIVLPLKQKLIANTHLRKAKVLTLMYGIPLKINDVEKPVDEAKISETIKGESAKFSTQIQNDFNEIRLIEKRNIPQDNLVFASINDIEFSKMPALLFELYSKIKILNPANAPKNDQEKVLSIAKNLLGIKTSILPDKSRDKEELKIFPVLKRDWILNLKTFLSLPQKVYSH